MTIGATLLLTSLTVLANPQVTLKNNQLSLTGIKQELYGLELNIDLNQKDVTFTTLNDAHRLLVVPNETSYIIYITSTTPIDLNQPLLEVSADTTLTTTNIKIVDYYFNATQLVTKPNTPALPDADDEEDGIYEDNTTETPADKEDKEEVEKEKEEDIIKEPTITFKDTADHWAEDAIKRLTTKGILKGYEDGLFKPNSNITRIEFVSVIAEAFNLNTEEVKLPFKDTDNAAWYAGKLMALYTNNLINGLPDGTFGVSTDITNQDIAVILDRVIQTQNLNLVPVTTEITLTDLEDVSSYAKSAVTNLHMLGIVNGDTNHKFNPKAKSTRAQVAVMIDRLLTMIEQ
jgi:hypothetical protein